MGVVAGVAGVLAVLLQCVRGVPQVVHLWRACRVAGVSLATWTSTMVCSSLWAVFGVTHAMATQILGNCAVVASCVVVLALVARSRRRDVLRAVASS